MGTDTPSGSSPTLTIIGAGHVGRTLGRLWHEQSVFAISAILNTSYESSRAAAEFIGAGQPVREFSDIPNSDLYMISVHDDHIAAVAEELSATAPHAGAIAFHCSGALSSAELDTLDDAGLKTASLHPLNSFTAPKADIESFAGTYCAIEGHPDAVAMLSDAAAGIDGTAVPIKPEQKLLYHAGAVFACNYMSALLDVALSCYDATDIDRDTARRMIMPLVQTTIENIRNNGPATALTGPIARGDNALVAKQLTAVRDQVPQAEILYQELGKTACRLALESKKISKEQAQNIERILREQR